MPYRAPLETGYALKNVDLTQLGPLTKRVTRLSATNPSDAYLACMRRAVVVGLVWGVFCGIANGVPVATTLVQMAVPWVWVAAFVAYRAETAAGWLRCLVQSRCPQPTSPTLELFEVLVIRTKIVPQVRSRSSRSKSTRCEPQAELNRSRPFAI